MLQDNEILGGLLEGIQSLNHHQRYSKQWSLITIKDSPDNPRNTDFSVFPPVNHENLQIPSHQSRDQRKQQDPPPKTSPSLSLAPSHSDGPSSSSRETIIWWWDFGLQILRAKFWSIFSSFGNNNGDSRRGTSWSFGPAAGVAVLLVWWWFCRRIKRRRRRESVQRLHSIIKEKDEKINKLLHQIAQMNEVLVARHKVLASKLAN